MTRLPLIAIWLELAAYGLYLAAAYDDLPSRVASHFDATGTADGFQSKPAFAISTLLVAALLTTLFTVAPALLRKTPERFLNIPDKAYWLAPERRETTLQRVAGFNGWMGFATVTLTCTLFVLIVRANLNDRQLGASAWVLVGAFLVFVISQAIAFVRGFSRRD
jgi:uncharacterized membrane protein